MNQKTIRQILKDTGYVRTGGSDAERRCAEYLAGHCRALGAEAGMETFPVDMGEIRSASLRADGREIPCRGYLFSGSGVWEAPLRYLPNADPAALAGIRGKIVLLDTGVGIFPFQDLADGGAVGFITYDGNVRTPDRDIDQKELRSYVARGRTLPGVNVNA